MSTGGLKAWNTRKPHEPSYRKYVDSGFSRGSYLSLIFRSPCSSGLGCMLPSAGGGQMRSGRSPCCRLSSGRAGRLRARCGRDEGEEPRQAPHLLARAETHLYVDI